jgi:hypothetical protein
VAQLFSLGGITDHATFRHREEDDSEIAKAAAVQNSMAVGFAFDCAF